MSFYLTCLWGGFWKNEKRKGLRRLVILLMAVAFALTVHAQKAKDKKIKVKKEFPFLIGNVGFAIDSSDFFIGDVNLGSKATYPLRMYNYGDEEIVFTSGKSSQLISINYPNSILYPHTEGVANVVFDVVRDLPQGPVQLEVVIESNDELNPWKFLYLNANVVVGSRGGVGGGNYIDTVPRIVFNHYNFEYGHKLLNSRVRHDFYFTNMGSKELEIKRIELCEGCTLKGEPNRVIEPGENGSLVLVISTRGIGVAHRSIKVFTNDPVNPVIYLGIHGTVTLRSPAKKNPEFCKESF